MKTEKDKKLDELLKITNISEEELEKLDFKEKQKLAKVYFVSRNKEGKGLTYRKPKEVK